MVVYEIGVKYKYAFVFSRCVFSIEKAELFCSTLCSSCAHNFEIGVEPSEIINTVDHIRHELIRFHEIF